MSDFNSNNYRNNNDIREIVWVWWWLAQLLTLIRFAYGWIILPISLHQNLSNLTPEQVFPALVTGIVLFLVTELDGACARKSRVVSAYPGISALGATFDYLSDIPTLAGIGAMGLWLAVPELGQTFLSLFAKFGEVLVSFIPFLS